MIVVSDTSPLHYLTLIGQVQILPILYKKVLIPTQVVFELTRSKTPLAVRQWASDLPGWVEVRVS